MHHCISPLLVSELARQAVWVCMVEDPRLFFTPLLNQFNQLHKTISSKKSKNADHQVDSLLVRVSCKIGLPLPLLPFSLPLSLPLLPFSLPLSLPLLPSPSLSFFLFSLIVSCHFKNTTFSNTQAEILFPLHVVLQVFPLIPPSAAHFLFNNFVGIIMWHTDQPCTHSAKITQSVLTLTGMVSVELIESSLPSPPSLSRYLSFPFPPSLSHYLILPPSLTTSPSLFLPPSLTTSSFLFLPSSLTTSPSLFLLSSLTTSPCLFLPSLLPPSLTTSPSLLPPSLATSPSLFLPLFLATLLFSSFPPFLPPSLFFPSSIPNLYSFPFLPSTPSVTFLSYSPSIPPSSFTSAPHLLPLHPFLLPSSTFVFLPLISLSPALPLSSSLSVSLPPLLSPVFTRLYPVCRVWTQRF